MIKMGISAKTFPFPMTSVVRFTQNQQFRNRWWCDRLVLYLHFSQFMLMGSCRDIAGQFIYATCLGCGHCCCHTDKACHLCKSEQDGFHCGVQWSIQSPAAEFSPQHKGQYYTLTGLHRNVGGATQTMSGADRNNWTWQFSLHGKHYYEIEIN